MVVKKKKLTLPLYPSKIINDIESKMRKYKSSSSRDIVYSLTIVLLSQYMAQIRSSAAIRPSTKLLSYKRCVHNLTSPFTSKWPAAKSQINPENALDKMKM